MNYFPEVFYKPEQLNKEKLQERFENESLVSFYISHWDYTQKALVAKFADGIIGYLPEVELCIDKLKTFDPFPYSTQAGSLIGKTACALITDIKGSQVFLSRKKLQQKVFPTFRAGNSYDVYVKNMTGIGIFVDVAVGISGFIHNSELTMTHFNRFQDMARSLDIYCGKIIPAKVLSIDERIEMSYRRACLFPYLNVGDVTYATVRNKLHDSTGYFVEISPNDTAIVDSKFELNYGQKILVQIKSTETVFEKDGFYCQHHVRHIY